MKAMTSSRNWIFTSMQLITLGTFLNYHRISGLYHLVLKLWIQTESLVRTHDIILEGSLGMEEGARRGEDEALGEGGQWRRIRKG